jgi:hypothetical protein
MKNNYCVYVWKRTDTNKIFYVGHGSKNRALNGHNRSKEFNQVIDELHKVGLMPLVHIVKDDLSLLQALDLESDTMYICRQNNEPLVNKETNKTWVKNHLKKR